MKLSKLRCLCDKAIEKYGDINVGTYSKDYAYDIEQEADLHGFKLRILSNGGGLPGESLCEDALEILQEILHYDSSLHVWFDRDISFEVGSDLSANIVSLPRLVPSRSNEKLSDDSRITSKQSVKLAVVERAMYNIGRDATSASKPTVSKLDKFLNVDD